MIKDSTDIDSWQLDCRVDRALERGRVQIAPQVMPLGGLKNISFAGRALHRTAVQASCHDTTNNVSQRTNAIHEDPESRKGLRRLEDTMLISSLAFPLSIGFAYPLNIMVRENMRVATAPAVCALGNATIIMCANVLAKINI